MVHSILELEKETRTAQKRRLVELLLEYGRFPAEFDEANKFELETRMRFHLTAQDEVLDEALQYLLVYASDEGAESARNFVFDYVCKPTTAVVKGRPVIANLVVVPIFHAGLPQWAKADHKKLLRWLQSSLKASPLVPRGTTLLPMGAFVDLTDLANLPLHAQKQLVAAILDGNLESIGEFTRAPGQPRVQEAKSLLQGEASAFVCVAYSDSVNNPPMLGRDAASSESDELLDAQTEWSVDCSAELSESLGLGDIETFFVLRPLRLFDAILEGFEIFVENRFTLEVIEELLKWKNEGISKISTILQVSHEKYQTIGTITASNGSTSDTLTFRVPAVPYQSVLELEELVGGIMSSTVEELGGESTDEPEEDSYPEPPETPNRRVLH